MLSKSAMMQCKTSLSYCSLVFTTVQLVLIQNLPEYSDGKQAILCILRY